MISLSNGHRCEEKPIFPASIQRFVKLLLVWLRDIILDYLPFPFISRPLFIWNLKLHLPRIIAGVAKPHDKSPF